MHIESTLPLYWLLPLVVVAVAVAWVLYIRNQKDSVLPKPVRLILAVSRSLVVVVVGLLIISPWIRTTVTRQEKPYYLVVQDNSVSIPPLKSPSDFIDSRNSLIDNINASLEKRFQVAHVIFGDQSREGEKCTYTDPLTDPGDLFSYLRIFAQTHDLGGVFVTTDGVATKGLTFNEASRNFSYPLTVLASGDSTRYPDVRIQDVVSNEWVRKNSTFPVRVYYNTGEYTGQGFKLQIIGNKGVISEKYINTKSQTAPFEEFLVGAPDKGILTLTARILPDEPDKNQDNNSRNFMVRVIEQQGEILCLFESAHPDIDAVVQALKGTNSLNLTVADAADYKEDDKNYDLILLHGLPSLRHPVAGLLARASEKHIPILFILGKSTDPVLFNRVNHGMITDNRRKTSEAAQGILNESFSLFTLPTDFKAHLATWPPLDLNFEVFSMDPGSQIQFKQKILSIELSDPLVAFATTLGIKYGFICGEGIWKWRLHEFLEQKNHDYFDEWLGRSIQYLMLDENKDKFRIIIPEELYANSPVRINGHLLNSSLEAINDPDVNLTITDSAGQKNEYQMGRVNDYYELILNGFAPGNYRYEAVTKLGQEVYRREGVLNMQVKPVEQSDPVADFESLKAIADRTLGKFFKPGEENALLSYIGELKPSELRIKKEFKWYDLINFKWLLPFLIFLLGMEWFLRRWIGIR